jgi:hypothetical protein
MEVEVLSDEVTFGKLARLDPSLWELETDAERAARTGRRAGE